MRCTSNFWAKAYKRSYWWGSARRNYVTLVWKEEQRLEVFLQFDCPLRKKDIRKEVDIQDVKINSCNFFKEQIISPRSVYRADILVTGHLWHSHMHYVECRWRCWRWFLCCCWCRNLASLRRWRFDEMISYGVIVTAIWLFDICLKKQILIVYISRESSHRLPRQHCRHRFWYDSFLKVLLQDHRLRLPSYLNGWAGPRCTSIILKIERSRARISSTWGTQMKTQLW